MYLLMCILPASAILEPPQVCAWHWQTFADASGCFTIYTTDVVAYIWNAIYVIRSQTVLFPFTPTFSTDRDWTSDIFLDLSWELTISHH